MDMCIPRNNLEDICHSWQFGKRSLGVSVIQVTKLTSKEDGTLVQPANLLSLLKSVLVVKFGVWSSQSVFNDVSDLMTEISVGVD